MPRQHAIAALAFALLCPVLACTAETAAPADTRDLGKADDVSLDPPGCAFDPSDPFEPRARLPRGKYAGRCIDTRQARPVVHLSSAQAAPYGGLTDDEIVVANVFHDDAFWVARIPRDGVEAVLFQLEYFPAIIPAGHTQLRVRFHADRPVRLHGQAAINAGETAELRELVFSIEAIGQVGYQYDLVRGLVAEFGAVYRVVSLASRMDHMIVNKGHDVEQWELFLTDAEKRALLENYLDESDTHQMTRMYNTLLLNCTNDLLRIIDIAVVYAWYEQIGRFVVKATEVYPNVVRAALIARGLLPLDQSTDWPLLADDPTVQDILRDLRR